MLDLGFRSIVRSCADSVMRASQVESLYVLYEVETGAGGLATENSSESTDMMQDPETWP